LNSRLDFSAGWLGRHDDGAATLGVGPVFIFNRQGWPMSLEAGSGAIFMTRHDFGTVHLGTGCQFTTHIGLNWRFSEHFRITYRFEHTSNAGLASPNPGVNFHALALAYMF
jgi:lipid A 3-O-deacylase